jgi:hypothetical protein
MANDIDFANGQTRLDQALNGLGYAYTAVYGSNPGPFLTLLQSQSWDLVIVDHCSISSSNQAAMWDAIEARFNAGERTIIATYDVDRPDSLWTRIGVASAFNDPGTASIYWWDAAHPLFTLPNSVPEFTNRTNPTAWADEGDKLNVTGSGIPVGGFSQGQQSGEAAIVVWPGKTLILNSFIMAQNYEDLDGDSILDCVELWQNEIAYLIQSGDLGLEVRDTPDPRHARPGCRRSGSELRGHRHRRSGRSGL